MSVGELGHPFEQYTTNNEGDIDTYDTHEEFHAFLLVNSVEEAHILK